MMDAPQQKTALESLQDDLDSAYFYEALAQPATTRGTGPARAPIGSIL
jgi:hypothetical protein